MVLELDETTDVGLAPRPVPIRNCVVLLFGSGAMASFAWLFFGVSTAFVVMAPDALFAGLMAVFPVVGLCLVVFQLMKGLHAIRLLRYGTATFGVLIDTKPTGTSINDIPEIALTYQYQAGGKTYKAKAKVLEPDIKRLMDNTNGSGHIHEVLLYLPHQPHKAQVLDELGKAARFRQGLLVARSLPGTIGAMLLPGIVVAGLVILVLFRFGYI